MRVLYRLPAPQPGLVLLEFPLHFENLAVFIHAALQIFIKPFCGGCVYFDGQMDGNAGFLAELGDDLVEDIAKLHFGSERVEFCPGKEMGAVCRLRGIVVMIRGIAAGDGC